jgi:ABC-type Na+ efflux pump permease subunit
MNKIFVVAQREFMAMVATRAFLATLLIMPVLMFGGLFLMPALNKISGGKERTIRVVDGTRKIGSQLVAIAEERNRSLSQKDSNESAQSGSTSMDPSGAPDLYKLELQEADKLDDETRVAWSDEIRNGSLYAFVEIPESLFDSNGTQSARFVSQDAALSDARQWMQAVVDSMVRTERVKALGLDAEQFQAVNRAVALSPTAPYEKILATDGSDGGVQTKEKGFDLATIFAPFGMMMLMFLVIFLAAQPMLESAMEEKTQRIAEVLLGAVTPTQLMTGKLIGNVAASLLVFTLYGLGAYLILVQRNMQDLVPMTLVPWFLVFQVLGVLFFSSIFMVIGASVRELKEAQSLLLPVWLVMMLPMMVWFVAIRDPLGPVSVGLSLFPPSAPMMNILRLGTGVSIPIWQPIAATVLLAAATLVVLWIAGRVYRNSLLRSDSVKSLPQLFARLTSPTR